MFIPWLMLHDIAAYMLTCCLCPQSYVAVTMDTRLVYSCNSAQVVQSVGVAVPGVAHLTQLLPNCSYDVWLQVNGKDEGNCTLTTPPGPCGSPSSPSPHTLDPPPISTPPGPLGGGGVTLLPIPTPWGPPPPHPHPLESPSSPCSFLIVFHNSCTSSPPASEHYSHCCQWSCPTSLAPASRCKGPAVHSRPLG